MKKFFSIVAMMVLFTMSACSQDQVGTFDQLPQNAQELINQHFNKDNISLIKIDKDLTGNEYEVIFVDGTDLEFDKNGNLIKVDCGLTQVPTALVPEQVTTYVSTNYPNNFITEWGKEDRGWKAELNNGVDLLFNSQYEFTGIDD